MTQATTVKWRPVNFSGEMVRAIQDGCKTQTRRVVKWTNYGDEDGCFEGPGSYYETKLDRDGNEEPGRERFGLWGEDGQWTIPCPFGAPGDRLWVRETFRYLGTNHVEYKCDSATRSRTLINQNEPIHGWLVCDSCGSSGSLVIGDKSKLNWKSSTQMPRWASRINLGVVEVRVERLQDISEEDAVAEGITQEGAIAGADVDIDGNWWPGGPVRQFQKLWHSIYGDDPVKGWDANPFVWVVTFDVVR